MQAYWLAIQRDTIQEHTRIHSRERDRYLREQPETKSQLQSVFVCQTWRDYVNRATIKKTQQQQRKR